MNGFYINPWAISELVFFILSLAITVYLVGIKRKASPTRWLVGYAATMTSIFLILAVMYLSPLNVWNYVSYLLSFGAGQVCIVFLLQFAYHFPSLHPPQRREAHLALVITLVLTVLTAVTVAVMIFSPTLYYTVSPEPVLNVLTVTQYLWIFVVLVRRAVQLSESRMRQGWLRALVSPQGQSSRAVWAYALVASIPLWASLLIVTVDWIFDWATLLVQPVLFLAFVLVYLTTTPEATTFLVKVVGVTLVTVLAILSIVGIIFWNFLHQSYNAQVTFADPQALRFTPNAEGSYTITRIPAQFDTDLETPLALAEDGSAEVPLQFPFPLFGREWDSLYVTENGVVTFGVPFNVVEMWRGLQPAIVPLLGDFTVGEVAPVWVKSESQTMTLTWNELSEYQGPERRNTFQVVLRADGTFDLVYAGMDSVHIYYPTYQMWDARVRGVFAGKPGQPVAEINLESLLAQEQPYIGVATGGIIEPYYAFYRQYIHTHMLPLTVLIVTAAVAILLAFPFLFRAILVKPLEALVEGMRQLDAGNLEVKVAPRFNDEIGFLAHSFNTMVAGLREREWLRDIFGRFVSPEVAEALRTGQVKLEGENRLVSVLFCDIRSFTARSERATPQEIVALLNAYLPLVVEAAQRHHGTVNKFGGDSTLIIYGAPRRLAGSAYQAVLTALELHASLKQLNAQLAAQSMEPVQIGVGINTGMALAGAVGPHKRQEYTVIGDAVNLAARIQDLNREYPQHSILISDATYEALGEHRAEFACEDLGLVEIRGKADPVRIWAVKGWAGRDLDIDHP